MLLDETFGCNAQELFMKHGRCLQLFIIITVVVDFGAQCVRSSQCFVVKMERMVYTCDYIQGTTRTGTVLLLLTLWRFSLH